MAGSEEIAKLAVSLSLEAQGFDKQMSSINKSIKNSERDFKSAGKGVEGFEKSFVGLDAKIQKTSKQLDLYNTKLEKQKEQYTKIQGDLESTTKKLDELEKTQGRGSEQWKKQSELVQKNAEKLSKLGTDINQTESNISKLTNELNQSQKEFDQLGNKAKTLDENLEDISRQADLTQSEFDKLGSELQTSGNYFSKLGNEMNKMSAELTSGKQKIDAYENEIKKLGDTLDKNKQDHNKLGQEINKTEQELNQAKSAYGENSNEALQLSQKLLKLKDEYNNVETEIEQNANALNKYQTELNQTQTEVNELANELRTMPFDKIGSDLVNSGQAIKGVGQSLTTGITLPLVAAGAAATKVGVDFDRSMSKVGAISGATGDDLEILKDKALELGSSTKFSASQVADAMTYMGMAGWSSGQMLEGVEGILNLAAAGAVDLATASDIVTDGLTAMGMTAKDSGDYVDIMAATITSANTSVELMGETMKYAGPVAGALGIEMEDLSVAIGLMGNAGIKGSQSGTALRGGLTRLVDPTSEAASMMDKYGVAIQKTDDGSVDLQKTMVHLRDKLSTLDATTQATALSTIFGKEAMSGWASVINASDADFENLTNNINTSTKTVKAMEAVLKETGTSTESFKSTLEAISPAAELLNIDTRDLTVAIGLMNKAGLEGAQSGEEFGNSLKNLVSPTEEVQKQLDQLGINIQKNSDGSLNFVETTKALQEGLGGLDEATRQQALSSLFGADATDEWNAILSATPEEFDAIVKSMDDTKGLAEKLAETMQENLGGSIDNMKSSIEGALYEGFKAMEPVLQTCIEKITDLAKWFTDLDEEQQKNIVTIAGVAAAVGPLLMIVGNLIIVGGNAVTLFGKLQRASGLATSALALFSGPVGIGAAVLAIGGLLAAIGDNEDAILRLQEKFGGLGTLIGGVCEFISGTVQINFGNAVSWIKFAVDAMAAMIDGPGGATIEDAWENHSNRVAINYEEGMSKLTLSTTRGMSQMRNASDEQLQGTVESMNTILSNIPDIVEGNYSQASSTLGSQLAQMDSTQITILQGMNDTTQQMFLGIQQGMNVDEASAKVEENLKRMAQNGTLDASTMEKEVTKALEQMKKQMDTKTKEGAQAVDKNSKEAANSVKTNTDKMAKDAKTNTGKVATDTDSDFKKANKSIQQSSTDMYNGAKTSFTKLAEVSKQSGTDMYNGVRVPSEKIPSVVNSAMVSAVSNATSANSKFKSAGVNAAQSWITGFNSKKSAMSAAVSSIPKPRSIQIDNIETNESNTLLKAKSPISDSVSSSLSGAINDVDISSSFRDAGQKSAKAYAEGLSIMHAQVNKMLSKNEKEWKSGLSKEIELNKKHSEELEKINKEKNKKIKDLEDKRLKEIQSANSKYAKNKKKRQEATKKANEKFNEELKKINTKYAEDELKLKEKHAKEQDKLRKEQEESEKNFHQNLEKIKDTYQQKVQSLNDKYLKEEQKLNEEYQKIYDSRVKSLMGWTDIFSEIKGKDNVSSDKLINNLNDQVEVFKNWDKNIQSLSGKISNDLYEELLSKGPNAYKEIEAIASMTKEELAKYDNLYKERKKLAEKRAEEDTKDEKDRIEKQIADLKTTYLKEYEKLGKDMAEEVDKQVDAIKKKFGSVPAHLLKLGKDSIQSFIDGMKQASSKLTGPDKIIKKATNEWNRLRNIYSKPLKMDVFINTIDDNFKFDFNNRQADILRVASIKDTYQTKKGYYSNNRSTSKQFENMSNFNFKTQIESQNGLLNKLIGVFEGYLSKDIEISIVLDGRELTRVVSKNMAAGTRRF